MHDSSVQGPFKPQITVVGVGGAGGNAVNNMIESGLDGVSFLVLNTDAQALENSYSDNKIQLGSISTGGLGAGARPEVGRAAAEESLDDVMNLLRNQNMVFITAGMGGGTGTGAAPVIAKACKDEGILTVGVVTKPFQFEGAQRMRLADAGIDEMAQYVDTLIVIPNQNLFRLANEKTTFAEAFRMADNVLLSGVKGVADLMVVPGMINLDFADIRSATSEMGKAMMGTGEATGERRAIEAAEQAINNPLLDDVSMKGARSVIINVTGGHDLTLFEIEEACNRINEEVDPDATIIFGSTYDDSMEGSMRITVVATGIEAEINRRAAQRPIRPTNMNVQPQMADETVPMSDSFTTRYPEPSRVSSSYHTTPAATKPTTQQAAPAYQPTPVVETPRANEPAPSQHAAAASYTPAMEPVAATHATTAGYAEPETNYVSEGSAMRKIEVQPEETHTTSYNENVIPPYAPPKNEQRVQESSLVLTPPTRPVAQQEQKRTPSLFERITGRSKSEEETDGTTSSTGGAPMTMSPGLTAERQTLVTSYDVPPTAGEQGTLNIDPPKVESRAAGAASADNLDIPAFLRRQIS